MSGKSSVLSQTPQSNIQSLAYSNEVDHDRRGRRVGSRSAWCGHRHYGSEEEAIGAKNDMPEAAKFKVYSSRWMMLLYLSLLNGLSDWTCYSIAPISILTSEALDVDTEILVTVFLASSVVGTFLEPAVLKWLRLQRLVLLGAPRMLIPGRNSCSGGLFQPDRYDFPIEISPGTAVHTKNYVESM